MSATENETPRKMTPTERLYEMGMAAITSSGGLQTFVALTVDNGKVIGWNVRVGADGDRTVDDCASEAASVHADLLEQFPPRPEQPTIFDVELTRNAKGETQVKVSAKHADPLVVAEKYEAVRGRYPLADGTATHDAPRTK